MGVTFLIVLAVIWILFATFSDLKTTEIFNWLTISLVIFALGFRFFYSLFSSQGFGFFWQGLIGFGIFFVLGNFLYYSRVFAGGDEKLMISLGAILPFSMSFVTNVKIFVSFLFLFLFAGAAYGIFASGYLAARNSKQFRKEFKVQNKKLLKFNIPIFIFGLLIFIFGIFYNQFIIYLGILVLFMPVLYLFSKSVDEACMIKNLNPEKLMEGDWLYKDVKVGRKTIKANWDGLTKDDIKLLKKRKKPVVVRRGIVFAPTFLISFLVLIYIYAINNNLFVSLWNSIG